MKKNNTKLKTTKIAIVKKLLAAGKKITRWELIQKIGAVSLPDIVFKLRNHGWNIHTEMKETVDRFGNKTEYATYWLLPERPMIAPIKSRKKPPYFNYIYYYKYEMTTMAIIKANIRLYMLKKLKQRPVRITDTIDNLGDYPVIKVRTADKKEYLFYLVKNSY